MSICQCCKENNASCLFEKEETCGECFANLTIVSQRLSFFDNHGHMPMLNVNPCANPKNDERREKPEDYGKFPENFETGFD